MKRLCLPAILAALIVAAALAQAPAKIRVLWTSAGPSNPDYEWVNLSAAGGGLVFSLLPGKSWDYATENGKFKEAGSTIAAFDLATGKRNWSAESRWPILSPLLLTAGRLIAHNGYGEVMCFDAPSGKLLWKTDPPAHPGSWDERTMPSAEGNFVFLREENSIVCRGLSDGRPVWRSPIEAIQNRRVFPAAAGGKVFVANSMDAAFALDAKDGRVVWKKPVPGAGETVIAEPASALVANADRVFRLAAPDGRELWRYGEPPLTFASDTAKMKQQDPRQLREPIWNLEKLQALAIGGDNVFLFQRRVMYPEGRETSLEIACQDLATARAIRWTESVGSEFRGFSVAGPFALIVEGGTVRALRLDTGKTAWEYQLPGEERLQGQPLAIDGKILVVGTRGLTCLETGDPRITGWPQSGGSAARSGSVQPVPIRR